MQADIKTIIQLNNYLQSENANWVAYYQDIADYCLPRKAWQTSLYTKGDRLKSNFLYDSTAIRALKICAAGFHSNLTNPTARWFALQMRDMRLMELKQVKAWCRDCTDRILAVINGSNFDTTMQEFYLNYVAFGTSTIMTVEDIRDKVRFLEIPMNQLQITEDAYGRIHENYRTVPLTAIQASLLWGKAAGEQVSKDVLEDRPFKKYNFLHYIGPREDRDVNLQTSVNLPIASVWINLDEKLLVKESGFHESPIATGRYYKDPSEVRGFSATMDVLPDIRLLNGAKRTVMRRAMKEADPPVEAPNRGYMLPLNFNPSAINYRNANVQAGGIKPIVWPSNFSITQEFLDKTESNINDGLNVPLFRAISDLTKQMTIPEMQRRVSEQMVLLGPVVGRAIHEAISPTVLRVFAILYRNGELPQAPAEIQGQELDVQYLSPLALAQKQVEISNLESFLMTAGAMAKVKPAILDKIDEDATIEEMASMRNINPKLIRDQKEVLAIRQQTQQLQQAQIAATIAKDAGAAAKAGAEAQAVAAQPGGQE